jgi:PAS domain S-box-containing protein
MKMKKNDNLTFNTILDNLSNVLILVNSLGKITYVNSSLEKLLKYSKNELEGRSIEILIVYEYKESLNQFINSTFKNAPDYYKEQNQVYSGI